MHHAKSFFFNHRNNDGKSAIHEAFYHPNARFRHEETNEFTLNKFSPLLEVILKYQREANLDLEARDSHGRTPMHYLYLTKPKNMVEQFLQVAKNEYNIDFDLTAQDDEGDTPPDMSGQPLDRIE